jgi:hypothetical protein
MLKLSTWISVRTNTSDHGQTRTLKDAGVNENRMIGVQNALNKCLFISSCSCVRTDKNLKDWGRANLQI